MFSLRDLINSIDNYTNYPEKIVYQKKQWQEALGTEKTLRSSIQRTFSSNHENIQKIASATEEAFGNIEISVEKLNLKAKQIREETLGFKAFFRYLFRSTEKEAKRTYATRMETLAESITTYIQEHIRERLNRKRSTLQSIPEDQNKKALSQDQNPPKKQVEQLTAPLEVSSSNSEAVTSNVLSVPVPLMADPPSNPPLTLSSGVNSEAIAVPDPVPTEDIPVPPPMDEASDAPPPPPMDGDPVVAVKPRLTPEELHKQSEERRLTNELNKRADPNRFYEITPPSNASELQKDLDKYQELLGSSYILQDSVRATIESWAAERRAALAGSLRAIGSSDADFEERIVQYTNEELKILMGILFLFDDGCHRPSEQHPNHVNYSRNKRIYDEVFGDWENLAASKSGQAFLKHQENWQRYLSPNISGVIRILERRNIEKPKNGKKDNPQRLEDPQSKYTPRPYNPEMIRKREPLRVVHNSSNRGSLLEQLKSVNPSTLLRRSLRPKTPPLSSRKTAPQQQKKPNQPFSPTKLLAEKIVKVPGSQALLKPLDKIATKPRVKIKKPARFKKKGNITPQVS